MKLLLTLIFPLIALGSIQAADKEEPIQTQAEMNQEAAADFRKADAKLNVAYKAAQATLDAEGQAKLKTAQRAWIAFRDAEADLQADTEARGGTMAPCIYNGVRQQLTETRTSELEGLVKDR